MNDFKESQAPVTVIVPARNEEENIAAALASVEWADEVIVADSFSTDRTGEIAHCMGARVVQFKYEGGFPRKRNWVLDNVDFRNAWVLLLDADERVSPALRAEIEAAVKSGGYDGYCIDREFILMDRSIRCFRPNWNLRLFKHQLGRFESLGLESLPDTGDVEVHEHVVLDGSIGFLRSPLEHDDYRGVSAWFARHNRYSTWEAHLYLRLRKEPVGTGAVGLLKMDSFRRRRVLRRLWVRMPGRPILRFIIWYVLRGGFLDGRPGFVFCTFMAVYEFMIGAKLQEITSDHNWVDGARSESG